MFHMFFRISQLASNEDKLLPTVDGYQVPADTFTNVFSLLSVVLDIAKIRQIAMIVGGKVPPG